MKRNVSLERRVARLERMLEKSYHKMADIADAKKHYLRHRLPQRNEQHRRLKAMLRRMERLIGEFRYLRMQFAHHTTGEKGHLMYFTQTERVKLYALLKADLRMRENREAINQALSATEQENTNGRGSAGQREG